MAKVTLMKREPTHLQIAHRALKCTSLAAPSMVTISLTGLKPNGNSGPNFSRRRGPSSKPRRDGNRCESSSAG